MHELLVFWLSVGVFFLMIEMFTGTLYGLSISLAGFILAVYVYFTGETSVGIVQAIILAVTSGVFCYFFPKWFASKPGEELKIGIDRSVGETFVLKQSRDEYKIVIDGVDYLVDSRSVTDGFATGKKVILEGHSNGIVRVTLL
ncbi:MAG: NfeD family protein [Patescibacteria group bacterium]